MLAQEWQEDETATRLRREINEQMREVAASIHLVGVRATMFYTPPAATGGPAGDISLLDNIFNLPNLQLSHRLLLDHLDQAIGIYRSWLAPLWRSLFNPFYWIGIGLARLAEIPFRILDSAGFDGSKAEGSFAGKATKAAIQAAAGVTAALGPLEKLDLLAPVVSAVHRLLGF